MLWIARLGGTSASLFAGEEDEPINGDFRRVLGITVPIFPVGGVQPSLDVEMAAFLHSLDGEGGERAGADKPVELRLRAALAAGILAEAAGGEADNGQFVARHDGVGLGLVGGLP